jgi:hypothetical protein
MEKNFLKVYVRLEAMSTLFKKPLSEVEFPDIQKLKDAKIEESAILDYKEQMITDDKLVKHVTAFSNTRGGDLIFGIKESDRNESGSGGYPVDIPGIIEDKINMERLEQIIISNIRPRIGVQFRKIYVPNSDRIILIIRIPEGQNRPYYDMKSHRYYKRYEYEAMPMDEFEIESLYQRRFFGASKLAKYVDEIILFHRSKLPEKRPERIEGHIIITPLKIDDRIIDTSDREQIKFNFDSGKMRFEPDPQQQYLQGIAKPSRYGIKWNAWDNNIEVHRNGLVHFVKDYGSLIEEKEKTTKVIDAETLASDLLQTIQFAEKIYSIYDFMGKVRIILRVINPLNSKIARSGPFPHYEMFLECDAEEIYIEREWDSWRLTEDYLEIGKSIMDEFSNY